MKQLIFGSRAMQYWFPDCREPKRDIDIITPEKLKSSREIEYHWCDSFQYVFDHNKDKVYVDPDFLYTIKVSHAAWDIHWEKTMFDIRFLQAKGCKLYQGLYEMLVKEWEVIHGDKKRVNLNKPNEYFFDDAVTRKYNHDQLHQHFKFYDEPLHTKIRLDLSKALPSKELWDKLSEDDKLKCALEEIMVIATERYLFSECPIPAKLAKYKAMKRLITSMTKGWFNLFLIVNFEQLLYYSNEHWKRKLEELK